MKKNVNNVKIIISDSEVFSRVMSGEDVSTLMANMMFHGPGGQHANTWVNYNNLVIRKHYFRC